MNLVMSKSIKDLSFNFWRQEAGGRRRLSFSFEPEKKINTKQIPDFFNMKIGNLINILQKIPW